MFLRRVITKAGENLPQGRTQHSGGIQTNANDQMIKMNSVI